MSTSLLESTFSLYPIDDITSLKIRQHKQPHQPYRHNNISTYPFPHGLTHSHPYPYPYPHPHPHTHYPTAGIERALFSEKSKISRAFKKDISIFFFFSFTKSSSLNYRKERRRRRSKEGDKKKDST
ncbi:hypothetical protein PP707_03540 [Acetobacter pasteurianus]|nr:hypothetical protein [Acetobacter pasteurianus]